MDVGLCGVSGPVVQNLVNKALELEKELALIHHRNTVELLALDYQLKNKLVCNVAKLDLTEVRENLVNIDYFIKIYY